MSLARDLQPPEHGACILIKSPWLWAYSHTPFLSERAPWVTVAHKLERQGQDCGLEQKERGCPGKEHRARTGNRRGVGLAPRRSCWSPLVPRGLGHMLGSEPAPPGSPSLCPRAGGHVKPQDRPRHLFIKSLDAKDMFILTGATLWTSGFMT